MTSYEDWYQLIPLADPAAGAAATYRIPGETWECIHTARFTYVASVAVANRFLTVDLLDGDSAPFARIMSPTALTAGLTRSITYAHGLGDFTVSAGGEETAPLPKLVLPPGFTVQLTAVSIDAGDQISDVSIYVTRAPSGEWADSPGSRPWSP
jgi:hypothetical protein